MLGRAFTKPRKSPQAVETSLRSVSIYDEFIFGLMDDIPLVSFNEYNDSNNKNGGIITKNCDSTESTAQLTLRQVLRASVGVMGESPLGMTEKVVLLGGKICAVKRFKSVFVKKREFGRRIEKLYEIGNQCEYLVPVTAYLYAKRIKFVLCDYYPMGSLADLLAGAREQGQTALEWTHRLKIVRSIAKAIEFIHSQNPPKEKNLKLNVHGNIKSSNVMIKTDFAACLSDYGFVQLAEHVAVDDTGQVDHPMDPPEQVYDTKLSQKSDIYNFGVVLKDILGCPNVSSEVKKYEFDEFLVEGRELKQATMVLNIAVRCTNSLADARPNIQEILSILRDSV